MVLLNFKNLGWVSKIQKRRHTYFFSIAKIIAVGSVLQNEDKMYSYLAKHDGKDVIVTYLDGMPRIKDKKVEMVGYNAFVEEDNS